MSAAKPISTVRARRPELLGVTGDLGDAGDRSSTSPISTLRPRESLPRAGRVLGTEVAAEAARDTERALVGDAKLLQRHVQHADAVVRLTSALREERRPIKDSFVALGLDYALARHAVWIRETLERYSDDHPEIATMGPSIVLLVREAARRFEREGRREVLQRIVADLARGMSRSEAREKYLPAAKRERSSVSRVIALVRAGRIEVAAREFAQCNDGEQRALQLFARGLGLVCRPEAVDGPDGHDVARVDSIAEAVGHYLDYAR